MTLGEMRGLVDTRFSTTFTIYAASRAPEIYKSSALLSSEYRAQIVQLGF